VLHWTAQTIAQTDNALPIGNESQVPPVAHY
jgi:hypothetical protein